jgi:HSP20 family protein
MMIRQSSPVGELYQLSRAMERMLDDPFFRPVSAVRATSRRLPLDVFETPEALVIEAALPGVKPEDVEVSVLGDVLTLTAGTEAEHQSDDSRARWREVRRGNVSRSVTLPQGVVADQATASFENGLLRLSIPKAQAADRLRIPVTVPVVGEAARIEAESAPSGTETPAGPTEAGPEQAGPEQTPSQDA